jgi:hypothetical protein
MTHTQMVRQAQRLATHRGVDPRNSATMVQRNIRLLAWLLDQVEMDLSECEVTQPLPMLLQQQAE